MTMGPIPLSREGLGILGLGSTMSEQLPPGLEGVSCLDLVAADFVED